MFKLVLEKAEKQGIKLPTSAGSSKKQESSKKNIYFCFIDYAEAFDCVDHSKLWKILKEMGIPDHLNCPLKNLYAGQEATVRTGHGTTDWFPVGKGICQGCIFSCRGPASAESRDILRMDDVREWRKIEKKIRKEWHGDTKLLWVRSVTLFSERAFIPWVVH